MYVHSDHREEKKVAVEEIENLIWHRQFTTYVPCLHGKRWKRHHRPVKLLLAGYEIPVEVQGGRELPATDTKVSPRWHGIQLEEQG